MKTSRYTEAQILAILRQAEISSWAWRRLAKRCSFRHSSRKRSLKLSTNPFCIRGLRSNVPCMDAPGAASDFLTLATALRSSSFVYPASGCDLQCRGPSW